MSELDKWDSFYVIVGSAAGALIGLQFVVMTLMAERPPPRASEAAAAFATPTIVHFSVVLLLSALLRVPWDSVMSIADVAGLIGLAGVVYMLVTAWRMRRQTVYRPDSEDWTFHILLPFAAYAVLAGSAFAALTHEHEALFMLGGAALLLLFSAIHNAWDAGAYHVMFHRSRDRDAP
jgi:nucleoside recognition membrane protein YjiH